MMGSRNADDYRARAAARFKAPEAVEAQRKGVVWPTRARARSRDRPRAARGAGVQDVLPPSVHPDPKKTVPMAHTPRDGFPPLPDTLL